MVLSEANKTNKTPQVCLVLDGRANLQQTVGLSRQNPPWLDCESKPRAVCQKPGGSPGVGKCPTPGSDKAGKCPAVARGGGGGGMGAAVID